MKTWIIVNKFHPTSVWTKHGWEYRGTPIEFSDKETMLPRDGEWVRLPT